MSRLSTLPSPALLALLLSLSCWVATGCRPAEKPASPEGRAAGGKPDAHAEHADEDHADHDAHEDHDHPKTLAAGIKELEELSVTIAAKLATDAKEEADEAVHAAGHLIEDLRGLLDKETLTTEAKEAGTKALDEIYECFDKLDVAFHEEAKEGAESLAEVHTAIASRFAEAIKSLKERFATEEK